PDGRGAHRPDGRGRSGDHRRRGSRRGLGARARRRHHQRPAEPRPPADRRPFVITALAAAAGAVDPLPLAPNAAAHSGLGAVGMVVVLTLVTLLPAIVLSCTCFVRFVVVLGFVRTGIGTPSAPPNQVLVGLALFMSAFVSAPVTGEVY